MKTQYIYRFGLVVLLSLILFLDGCKDKKETSKHKQLLTVTAKLKSTTTKLFYKGTLQALKNIPVLSPVDGTVAELHFKYGDAIEDGQLLTVVNSTKLASDYRQAVSKYLQAKNSFETTKRSFEGTQALHKAGVISTDEYMTGKSQLETNTLNFYQAKYDLEKVLKKAGVPLQQIEKLSITDTQAVAEILQKKFTHIKVNATGSGVALSPTKEQAGDDNSSGGKSSGKLVIGSQVKEGQLILSIGDLTGFSATLQVSEININRMKTGLKTIITGYAFPNITLHGKVTSVAKQGNPREGSGGSLSLFNIIVQIPDVTAAQRKAIHVGMTANFEIDIKNSPRIMLPIKAVFQKNGQNMVVIIDSKTGKQKNMPVATGSTTESKVEIVRGVKAGDKVVIHKGAN